MLDFSQGEYKLLQDSLRRIIEEDINPHVDEWEEARTYPAHEVFKKMGDAGFLGVHKPEEYGGLGLDYSYAMAMTEELGNIDCGGVPMAIGVQTDMATPALARIEGPVAIDEGGRVSMELDALRDLESLSLALALGPEARGDGVRRALIVSVDGRRLERRTVPLDDRPDGVRLELDADFLRRGRYLIQIDTDDGPLPIRRYVLEID